MASRARLVTASDAARRRVTRDLHDGAQQRFVTTLINLQLAEQKWESAPQRARELLGLALRDARRGLGELREIVAGIHPAILTQRGLAAAIDALAGRLPIPVELDVPGTQASRRRSRRASTSSAPRRSPTWSSTPGPRSAWVRVAAADDRCTVEVRDDGIGGRRPRSESQRPDRPARPDRRAQRHHGHHQPGRRRHRAARQDPATAWSGHGEPQAS